MYKIRRKHLMRLIPLLLCLFFHTVASAQTVDDIDGDGIENENDVFDPPPGTWIYCSAEWE